MTHPHIPHIPNSSTTSTYPRYHSHYLSSYIQPIRYQTTLQEDTTLYLYAFFPTTHAHNASYDFHNKPQRSPSQAAAHPPTHRRPSQRPNKPTYLHSFQYTLPHWLPPNTPTGQPLRNISQILLSNLHSPHYLPTPIQPTRVHLHYHNDPNTWEPYTITHWSNPRLTHPSTNHTL